MNDKKLEIAAETAKLTADITAKIARLRAIAVGPVAISYSSDVSFEIRPESEGDGLSVYRKGQGVTVVKYSPKHLLIDVFTDSELKPLHLISVPTELLASNAG